MLASLLSDDQLYVDSDSGTCGGLHLAVEADATNILNNTDCGGRTLDADVIDVTYSVSRSPKLGWGFRMPHRRAPQEPANRATGNRFRLAQTPNAFSRTRSRRRSGSMRRNFR